MNTIPLKFKNLVLCYRSHKTSTVQFPPPKASIILFWTKKIPLKNQALIRADMGNGWYEEGKLAKKPNTFYDFCSAAEYLVKEGYTVPEKLSIYGRSAGGLLIGAVINLRPDLFRAALTEVPFVDVINTMFDTSIPWTAFGILFLLSTL